MNDRLVPMAEVFSLVSSCKLQSTQAFSESAVLMTEAHDEQPGASSGTQGYRGTSYFLLDHP